MARKTKAEAEATREKIISAAENLFYVHGVSKTSLEQIAEEAGLTRGAIYWHFENKVQLFRALHESVRLPQEDIIERASAEGHPDPLRLLEEVAIGCLETLRNDPRRQRIYAILLIRCEYVGDMIEALERQHELDREMLDRLTKIFSHAKKSKLLDSNWSADTAAVTFSSMMKGLWADWLRFGKEPGDYEDCIRTMFRSFRRAEKG